MGDSIWHFVHRLPILNVGIIATVRLRRTCNYFMTIILMTICQTVHASEVRLSDACSEAAGLFSQSVSVLHDVMVLRDL